ncbi:helix-turn-helix domain-containing protein [Ruegeria sp.]|uniref:helix-turn-helix domain-containing protein n=1 Tax=Ruegeria sp. TaxID=1879320 RepID=UPI003B58EDBF
MDLLEVGRRLDALRAATGLEKGEFADTVKIDRSSYSKIIKGTKPLKIEMGYQVSERWDVSLDFLYRGQLDKLPSSLSKTIIEHLNNPEE